MGSTVPAVKSILFRARAELRERLAKYLGETPNA
jgi:DNA-directed RNA polymerase specialized sigma24 family protein